VHREVPNEETTVKSSGALNKRHRGRHLVTGRRRQPEERTRKNCGSSRKLVSARRGTTCVAGVARRKGNVIGKNHTRGNVVRGTWKLRPFGRRYQPKPEGKGGIKGRGTMWQMPVKNEKAAGIIFRKTCRLEIARRAVGSSVRLRKIRDWILGRGQPPLKREKKMHSE
jgi:hypothetical protein